MTASTVLSPQDPTNPVSSFEAGVITTQGMPVGMCVKFKHFDGAETLSHWPLPQFARLVKALLEYMEHGRNEQFMFKAHADPGLVANLPSRHPYHTLLSERPNITESEVGGSSPMSRVAESIFADRGTTLVIKIRFANETDTDIYMHEYTAFSLYGYLIEYVAAFDTLSGPTSGGAH